MFKLGYMGENIIYRDRPETNQKKQKNNNNNNPLKKKPNNNKNNENIPLDKIKLPSLYC